MGNLESQVSKYSKRAVTGLGLLCALATPALAQDYIPSRPIAEVVQTYHIVDPMTQEEAEVARVKKEKDIQQSIKKKQEKQKLDPLHAPELTEEEHDFKEKKEKEAQRNRRDLNLKTRFVKSAMADGVLSWNNQYSSPIYGIGMHVTIYETDRLKVGFPGVLFAFDKKPVTTQHMINGVNAVRPSASNSYTTTELKYQSEIRISQLFSLQVAESKSLKYYLSFGGTATPFRQDSNMEIAAALSISLK